MSTGTLDPIPVETAGTLHGLLRERAKRSPDAIAYRYFDRKTASWQATAWADVDATIARWHACLAAEQLPQESTIGIMMPNCPEWIYFEQAGLRQGMVVVPLYPNDRPDNLAHIINEANIRILIIRNGSQWELLREASARLNHKPKVIHIDPNIAASDVLPTASLETWLQMADAANAPSIAMREPASLATIVYTSGTTGRPKGVMLSHHNILANAWCGIGAVDVYTEDLFLSFLPLSHTLERTIGCYLPMMCGSTVAFSRSIPDLPEDLQIIKPTILISVPRIFERVYGKIKTQLQDKGGLSKKLFELTVETGYERFEIQQGRARGSVKQLLWPLLRKIVADKVLAKLGGRMRFAISGGAALPREVGRTFIGLGLPILQGYGLTEASPVISVNRLDKNIPTSIGPVLPGIEVRLSAEGELQTRSPCVMLGYWQREDATRETLTEDGWLRSGDLAKIENDFIYITGRIKEILVLSNGEKVSPVDAEMAITLDTLFEQAMVIGEGKPYLAAIVVLNPEEWKKFCVEKGLDETDLTSSRTHNAVLDRLNRCMAEFPGYAQIRRVTLTLEPWTDQNGLLTASLKMRRKPLMDKFQSEIDRMYAGH